MFSITEEISIPDEEIELKAIRSGGPGGQNVNKVSSAIHLRFDVNASSLPAPVKNRLLQNRDQRITADGIIVIKAQNHRTQEKNRAEALSRLRQLIKESLTVPPRRIPTRPSRASKQKRIDSKKKRSALKKLRAKDHDPRG